jgi:HK97 family phage prohead protease
MKRKTETRSLEGCELRADSKNEFAITGVAARYNVKTNIGGMFSERIAPGAFTRSIRSKADVVATFNHSENVVLGRTTAGTLTLTDSPEGLRFRVQLDRKNQSHRDLYASVQRQDIKDCSFAFLVPKGGDEWDGNERTLRNVELKDVSVVVHPAYSGTSATARSKSENDELDADDIDECECDCPECQAGDCEHCSNEDCESEGCTNCGQRNDPDETDDLRKRLAALKV